MERYSIGPLQGTQGAEYQCLECGHSFPRFASDPSDALRCPRCGGTRLEQNLWLLGTSGSASLTEEDYFEAGLAV